MERPLAIAMKPAPPKSILKLNDDCMAEVLNYLSVDDVFKVVQTDARFRSSARLRFSSPKLAIEQINKEFIRKYPRDLLDLFFEAFGKTATQIKFKLLPESEFLHIVSYFSQLQNLTLSEITITEATDALPLELQYLEIDRCDIADSVMSLWFPKLAPDLRSLRIIGTSAPNSSTFVALNSLQKLTQLVIDCWGHFDPVVLATLIRDNAHLTSLTITNGRCALPNEMWNSIAGLQKLEHLQINASGSGTLIISVPAQLFPSLKTLTLDFCDSATKSIIESLACESSLTSLSLTEYNGNILPLSSVKRFKNLQNLELLCCDWLSGYEVQECSQLKQLQSLILDCNTFDTSWSIIETLKNMPNLRKFHGNEIAFLSDRITDGALMKKLSRLSKSRTHPLEFEVDIQN